MRQALGRGLDALLPSSPEASLRGGGGKSGIQKISIDKIRPNHLQTRKHFDAEKLSDLAQSIKQNGLAQPILVTQDQATGSYELITGERRLRACQLAGLSEIEVIIRATPSEKERLVLNLIENLQREDLNPLEEALGYLRLMKEYNINQTQLTEVVGKSKSAVSNTLRLLDLPEEVQKALQNGQISEGHARALLQVKDPIEIIKFFHKIIAQSLSVREVEDSARRLRLGNENSIKRKPISKTKKSADIISLEESLQHALGTKVDIRLGSNPSQGSIAIHFYNLSDFEKIIGKLK